jgi:hypothetical protein
MLGTSNQLRTGIRGSYTPDPSRSFDDQVKTACIHEAGHIVAGFTLGFKISFAIVQAAPTSGVGGYTEHSLGLLKDNTPEEIARVSAEAETPEGLRLRAMQALAGGIAESWLNSDHNDIDAGARDDDLCTTRFAMLALGPTATTQQLTDYFNERMAETRVLLKPLLPAVLRVTNHLLAHLNEQVPGDTLAGLVTESAETV